MFAKSIAELCRAFTVRHYYDNGRGRIGVHYHGTTYWFELYPDGCYHSCGFGDLYNDAIRREV